MKSNDSLSEIWSKLRDKTKDISDDILEEKGNNSYFDEIYKYKSKTKKGKNGHIIFLYLRLKKELNKIEVLLDTGKNPDSPLKDPNGITSTDKSKIWRFTAGQYPQIPAYILVSPDDIKSGYKKYDDIRELIFQSYKTLNLPK